MNKTRIVTSLVVILVAQISLGAPKTQTREFRLEFSEASGVASAIQTLFERTHPLLNIKANEKNNSLAVTGSADDIKEVEDLVRQTDVMAQQVFVEAIIVETDHSGQDKILSAPMLLTINGQQAMLSSTEKRPILVQGKEQIPPQFAVSSGMSLLITPYIQGSEIFLEGELELSSGPEQAAIKNGKGESVLIDSKRIVFSTQIAAPDEPYVIGPVATEEEKSITVVIQAYEMTDGKPKKYIKKTGSVAEWLKKAKANK
ncbi:MAG: secretin N-terminal domain-containing protein [Opitutales bacterium]|nr:secretin N-terminal domain-containing protein [Opitutales bacterium]